PILNEVKQRAAGLYDLGRQSIHLDVAVIAYEDVFAVVEQDNTLRHVVENHREQVAIVALETPEAAQEHKGHRGKNRGDGNGESRSVRCREISQDRTRPDRPAL